MKEKLIVTVLSLLSIAFGIGMFEVVARLLIQPSPDCYGVLFGRPLPPCLVLAQGKTPVNNPNSIWKKKDLPNPDQLTVGDLWGFQREDKVLGYATEENKRSVNGWWESNNIGARSKTPTTKQIPRGKRRLLVFGESFSLASRVSQENTWLHHLEDQESGLEIVNLGVDGYGMGQAFLRYLSFRDKLDWNSTVFVWVPDADLWRDINTVRYLGERWIAYTVMPRFVLDGDGIRAVPGPYEIGSEIYDRDVPVMTERVRQHLRTFDRFYLPLRYESPPVLGHLITYKLLAQIIADRQYWKVYDSSLLDPRSEAFEVTRRIFRNAQKDVREHRGGFDLIVLPGPTLVGKLRGQPDAQARKAWDERIRILRADGLNPIDLLDDLLQLRPDQIDLGYDRSHYGPRANRLLADILRRKLTTTGVLSAR